MHSEVAKIQQSTLFRISDTTSGSLESVSKIFVENQLYSQVVRANCIWQSERRELFARTVRVSVKRPLYAELYQRIWIAAAIYILWLYLVIEISVKLLW